MDGKLDALVPQLLAAATKPENINFNGTLVYALGKFDCSAYFPQLVEISVSHGYEACMEAMCAIDEQNVHPTQDQLDQAESILQQTANTNLLPHQKEALQLITTRFYESSRFNKALDPFQR
ncbi:hypothetical protein Rhal01_02089 [Rubritalea halochordaticola]|uniref:Uncharacterized protein n=1 Tax=Rubritalea halochordaticola TaxID=714537 RepID=A0ABP9UZP2_9BACT